MPAAIVAPAIASGALVAGSAGAIATTAVVGAIIGAAIGATVAHVTGGDPLKGALMGAAFGAISGAITGITAGVPVAEVSGAGGAEAGVSGAGGAEAGSTSGFLSDKGAWWKYGLLKGAGEGLKLAAAPGEEELSDIKVEERARIQAQNRPGTTGWDNFKIKSAWDEKWVPLITGYTSPLSKGVKGILQPEATQPEVTV